MKKNLIIAPNQNRDLIQDPPYPSEFKHGVILILNRLLGRVAPDENLVYLLLTVLPDEQINHFCEHVREENFTSNKLLCTENYYLDEIAKDICTGLIHKHHHMRLNKLMIEAFEKAYINKDLELPFYDRLEQLKSFMDLTSLQTDILHIYLHHYSIQSLEDYFWNSPSFYHLYALIIGDGISGDDVLKEGFQPDGALFAKGLLINNFGDENGGGSKNHFFLSTFAYNYFFQKMKLMDPEMVHLLTKAQKEYNKIYNYDEDCDSPKQDK